MLCYLKGGNSKSVIKKNSEKENDFVLHQHWPTRLFQPQKEISKMC